MLQLLFNLKDSLDAIYYYHESILNRFGDFAWHQFKIQKFWFIEIKDLEYSPRHI